MKSTIIATLTVAAGLTLANLWFVPAWHGPAQPKEKKADKGDRELTATKLVIKDKAGRDRIIMGTEDNEPYFLLMDQKKQARLSLSLHPDGSAGVHLYGDKRAVRVELASIADGTTQLHFFDARGRLSAGLTASPDEMSGFAFYDEKERTKVGLVVLPDQSRRLVLNDKDAKGHIVLNVSPEGNATLDLATHDGKIMRITPP